MSPCTPAITRMVVASQATAIACTVARLLYRWYTRQFWWEDVCAMIAAVWALICTVGFLLYDASMSYVSLRNSLCSWLIALSFTAVLWAVRLSIFLSLIRISNPTGSSRHIAIACVASFLIMFIASMIQKIYYCATGNCLVAMAIAIMQLITDILSDSALVLGPIPLLRGVHLSKDRRILIFCAFSSSILITAISVTHSVFLIDAPGVLTVILGQMKTATSLFICNILVLATVLYRVYRRCERDGDLDASFAQSGPLYLTTIDLGQVMTGTTDSDVWQMDATADASVEPGQDGAARAHDTRRASSLSVCADDTAGATAESVHVRGGERDGVRCDNDPCPC